MEKKATMKGAQAEQQADQRIIADHKSNAKPLDFSFLQIENIEGLKKLGPRSGLRRPIPESDDEEEDKKVSSSNNKFILFISEWVSPIIDGRKTWRDKGESHGEDNQGRTDEHNRSDSPDQQYQLDVKKHEFCWQEGWRHQSWGKEEDGGQEWNG